jgi:hypothetical protein
VNAALLAAGLPDLSRAGPDRFTEALDNAAREPAPEGKTRAVVVIATIEMHLDEGDRRQTVVEGWPSAVLAVNVPGRPPYAVFKHRFHVRRKGVFADLTGAGLPAFVSSDDPNDVEVAWDEIPSLMSQIGQRISDDLQTAQTDITQMQEEMTAAVQQAMQHPPGAPPGFAGLPEGIRDTMARNAKLALQVIKDPAQRQMLITQYRAAGITLDEEDLAT